MLSYKTYIQTFQHPKIVQQIFANKANENFETKLQEVNPDSNIINFNNILKFFNPEFKEKITDARKRLYEWGKCAIQSPHDAHEKANALLRISKALYAIHKEPEPSDKTKKIVVTKILFAHIITIISAALELRNFNPQVAISEDLIHFFSSKTEKLNQLFLFNQKTNQQLQMCETDFALNLINLRMLIGYYYLEQNKWPDALFYFNEFYALIEETPYSIRNQLNLSLIDNYKIGICIASLKLGKDQHANQIFSSLLSKNNKELFSTKGIDVFLPDYCDYLMAKNKHHKILGVMNPIFELFKSIDQEVQGFGPAKKAISNDVKNIQDYINAVKSDHHQKLLDIVKFKFNAIEVKSSENKIIIPSLNIPIESHSLKKINNKNTQYTISPNDVIIHNFDEHTQDTLKPLILEIFEKTQSPQIVTPNAEPISDLSQKLENLKLETKDDRPVQISNKKKKNKNKNKRKNNHKNNLKSNEKENKAKPYTHFRTRGTLTYYAHFTEKAKQNKTVQSLVENARIVSKQGENGFKWYFPKKDTPLPTGTEPILVGKFVNKTIRFFPSRILREDNKLIYVYDDNILEKSKIKSSKLI